MSKANRQKYLSYSQGNSTRLATNLAIKIVNDYNSNSNLLNNAVNEYNYNIDNKQASKAASIVRANKRTRLLNIQRKDFYSYYGKIIAKRNLSPRYLPKYMIQDTYYSSKVYDSYPNDNVINFSATKVENKTINKIDIVDDEIRKQRNLLTHKRFEQLTLKLVQSSRLKFDKYYQAINQ